MNCIESICRRCSCLKFNRVYDFNYHYTGKGNPEDDFKPKACYCSVDSKFRGEGRALPNDKFELFPLPDSYRYYLEHILLNETS